MTFCPDILFHFFRKKVRDCLSQWEVSAHKTSHDSLNSVFFGGEKETKKSVGCEWSDDFLGRQRVSWVAASKKLLPFFTACRWMWCALRTLGVAALPLGWLCVTGEGHCHLTQDRLCCCTLNKG